MTVAIIDYGSGNLHSAEKAFQRMSRETTGEAIVVTEDPEVAATTEEEESSDDERPPKSAKKSSTSVYVTPHGTSVMPPNILRMIAPV